MGESEVMRRKGKESCEKRVILSFSVRGWGWAICQLGEPASSQLTELTHDPRSGDQLSVSMLRSRQLPNSPWLVIDSCCRSKLE